MFRRGISHPAGPQRKLVAPKTSVAHNSKWAFSREARPNRGIEDSRPEEFFGLEAPVVSGDIPGFRVANRPKPRYQYTPAGMWD